MTCWIFRSLKAEHGFEQRLLAETVQRIAQGNLNALDELYALPARPDLEAHVAELAEGIGMILIKLEAREFHIKRAAEVEQRLKDLNQIKNRHLGIAAHDLRNPITSVRGMTQMMLQMELDEQTQRTLLESMFRVSDQMLNLVDDLLDISVIESGNFKPDLAIANVSEVAAERVELISGSAKEKGINLTTDLREVPDSQFDVGKISRAVDNLLSNALKFSPPETTVYICSRKGERTLEISVADQGPGIPAGELEDLFGTFTKSSVQPTGGEKSTGLGLAIVRKVMEAHDGEVSVDSEIGKGSTFTLHLPMNLAG